MNKKISHIKRAAIFVLFFTFTWAYAETINSVKYTGLLHMSDLLANEISNIKTGEQLDKNKVDRAIVAFYEQNYFEDIYADFSNGILTFYFKEKPRVASIEMKGFGSEQERNAIIDQGGIKKGDTFDQIKIDRAKTLIKTVLELQGYYGSVIEEEIEPTGESGAYAIVLNVNRGENIIINRAIYDGREKLKISEIESLTANKERELMGWMWGRNDGKLKLLELEYDGARIQDTYMRNGYLDATVSSPSLLANLSSFSANLYYKIREGKQYKISDVTIIMDSPVKDEKEIKKILKAKAGDIFNIENLRNDAENIKTNIADIGYAFARVSPDLDKDDATSEVKVIYHVQAGKKVFINDVIISGNSRTFDRIIRRELLLAPNDLYELSKVKRSENALRRLGYFENITIEERRVTEDSIDLLISVVEAKTGEMIFGVGYGSYDKLMLNASIRERNLFGTGQIGQVAVDWSRYRQLASVSLTNPRIFDSEYGASISVFKSLYVNYQYTEDTTGFGINVTRMLSDSLRVSLGYNLSTKEVSRFTDELTELYYRYLFFTIQRPIKSSITPGLYFDNTDDYYFPKNGIISSASVEYAGIGGDVNFLKYYAKFAGYYHLKNIVDLDFILRYKTQIGYLQKLKYTPLTENFYMGGISTVRGYYSGSITPYFYIGGLALRTGGNSLWTNSIEVSYGLVEVAKIRLTFFVDYGMLGVSKFNDYVRSSYGLALEWVSPIGPIVLVFPRAYKPQPGDRTSNFEFTMGTRF